MNEIAKAAISQNRQGIKRHSAILLSAVLTGIWLTGLAQTSRSPVGTWEATISGQNHGIARLTFNNDFTLSGYGMSLESFGMYRLTGNWSLDANGNIVGTYSEDREGILISGNFKGKAISGRRVIAKVVTSDGAFMMNGVPAPVTPDVSGTWSAKIRERGITVSDFITLTPSAEY